MGFYYKIIKVKGLNYKKKHNIILVIINKLTK